MGQCTTFILYERYNTNPRMTGTSGSVNDRSVGNTSPGLDFASTLANAPKIVRMRLNKLPWSHFAIFFYLFFIFYYYFFFLGLPLLVKKSLYPF